MINARGGQHDGQPCGLRRAEAGGAGVKVGLRGGFGAVDAVAPFHAVEVNLQNAALAQNAFEHEGDDQLLAFAQIVALGREKQVFGELLGDGGAADDSSAALEAATVVAIPGVSNGVPVHAVVGEKGCIFRGDHGAFEVRADGVVRRPVVLPGHGVAAFEDAQFGRAHEGGAGRRNDCPQRDAQGEIALQHQAGKHEQPQQAAPQRRGSVSFHAACWRAAASSARSVASTGAVAGASPCHRV